MRAMLRSAVLATAVTASLFSATSAVAGGAPDYGDVNVDRRVVLQDGALTIGGSDPSPRPRATARGMPWIRSCSRTAR